MPNSNARRIALIALLWSVSACQSPAGDSAPSSTPEGVTAGAASGSEAGLPKPRPSGGRSAARRPLDVRAQAALPPGGEGPEKRPSPESGAPKGMADGWLAASAPRMGASGRAFHAKGAGWQSKQATFSTTLDAGGVRVRPTGGQSEISLQVSSWGRVGAEEALPEVRPESGDCSSAEGADGRCIPRIERRHAGMTEWWVSGDQGVEFGFDADVRPEGDELLAFELDVQGAELEGDGDTVWLTDHDGGLWTLSGMLAWDADGDPLPAMLDVQDGRIQLLVDDAGAPWPITVDPILTTASTTLLGDTANSYFGWGISSAGDVDGDGYDDVVIGASGVSTAYVFHGSASGLANTATTILYGESATARFGDSVSGAGDVNADGYDDIIIGDYWWGSAYIYHGSPTGVSTTPSTTLYGTSPDGYGTAFGVVAGAGDVNADGYDDVIIGAPWYDGYIGRVYVYHGSPSGITTTVQQELTWNYYNTEFGYAVDGAGDVNADGYDDIIIGVPYYYNYAGSAVVYYGSAGGMVVRLGQFLA